MIILRDPADASAIAGSEIRNLVKQRFAEILAGEAYGYDRHGYMIVVEVSDTPAALEEESGCRILRNPPGALKRHILSCSLATLLPAVTGSGRNNMKPLSKSKLLAFRQCPRRLWLEVNRPDLREVSAAAEAAFAVGHTVGAIARRLYDPLGTGVLLDAQRDGFGAALTQSRKLLGSAQPLFEAAFSAGGALALADVLLPIKKGGRLAWQMVEVKASTGMKDYYRDDTAIQAFVARAAGVPLQSIALAHIDSSWVYPGGNDYQGLLTEVDVTAEAFGCGNEVKDWIAEAQRIRDGAEPNIATGDHCSDPFDCPFLGHCSSQEPQAEYPVRWLPRIATKALKAHIADHAVIDLREVPDDLLNARQLRVKDHTLAGTVYFDRAGARQALDLHELPAYFLDFETVQFAVPIWAGTRPYQQNPFQFSVHRLSRDDALAAVSFLDLSGADPARGFAERLVSDCGEVGPIFVYNAAFECTRIKELAERFPDLRKPLLALNARIVDLRPIAETYYYHPDQLGSWSIKSVLPAVAPDLRYDALDGVQDGGMAMAAYSEAIRPDTSAERKAAIEHQLREYCGLDTLAMVRLWQFFSGHIH